MLRKSLVFMMLLAASLIGISSAAHYQPEVAIAQPQPQQPQQSPQQGQLQSPNTASPTLGKRLTSPQGMQQQQQSNLGTLVQIQQDKALVDRLFPYIIQKIDGKTLAQKIDAATLVQKIDAKTLAAKVLPYLDIKVSVVEKAGQTAKRGPNTGLAVLDKSGKGSDMFASCAPDETLVSGGFNTQQAEVYASKLFQPNQWYVAARLQPAESAASYATCLHAELRF
ncbi:MAG TPA: hypothetical protein VFS97_13200 [Nitrososphaeraceae archaeon]|nr:hypothetical protein [Nitrososphaeraceae archaeon]